MPAPGDLRRRVLRAATGAALVALPTYAVIRGAPTADEQYQRFRAAQRAREKDMSTPMPSMTVKESYEKFAADAGPADKRYDPNRSFSGNLRSELGYSAVGGIGRGIGDTLGDVFIRTPVSEVSKFLKKKFVSEPKQRAALNTALSEDDVLGKTPRSAIDSAHVTLKRFSPALAEDPNAVKSYLRTAVMSHGGVDLATIRMILDAEKTRQQAKGKAVGP